MALAPLFSKVDSNKLWHDVLNEENVIYAQFGKDLFNTSKVIGRKKSGSVFFDSQCRMTSILETFLSQTVSCDWPVRITTQ